VQEAAQKIGMVPAGVKAITEAAKSHAAKAYVHLSTQLNKSCPTRSLQGDVVGGMIS